MHSVMQYTQTLTLVTHWYNKLQSTILAVELGLVKDEMDGMRQQLEPALRELTWAQDDLWEYIKSTRGLVKVLKISYAILEKCFQVIRCRHCFEAYLHNSCLSLLILVCTHKKAVNSLLFLHESGMLLKLSKLSFSVV